MMLPFIRSDQYHFIKSQAKILVNGYTSVNDAAVLQALSSVTYDKIMAKFPNMTDEQRQLISKVQQVKDKTQAESFGLDIAPYVIPFQELTASMTKKLFPKAKKLKPPELADVDMRDLSYLGWDDKGSSKKYLTAYHHDKLIGFEGSFSLLSKKGICAIYSSHAELGMFLTETKGAEPGMFIKRGNYICQDSLKCNQNIRHLDSLHLFIERLLG